MYVLILRKTFSDFEFVFIPEVRYRYDNQQVQSNSKYRNARQQDVKENDVSTMLCWLLAGGVK